MEYFIRKFGACHERFYRKILNLLRPWLSGVHLWGRSSEFYGRTFGTQARYWRQGSVGKTLSFVIMELCLSVFVCLQSYHAWLWLCVCLCAYNLTTRSYGCVCVCASTTLPCVVMVVCVCVRTYNLTMCGSYAHVCTCMGAQIYMWDSKFI